MDSEVARGKFPHGWHRTFYTLWLGAFITGMGYSMTMPFISLFIADLDIVCLSSASAICAITFSIKHPPFFVLHPLNIALCNIFFLGLNFVHIREWLAFLIMLLLC